MKRSFKTGRNIPKQIKGGNIKTMKKLSVIVLSMLFLFGMATAAFAASFNADSPFVQTDTVLVDELAPTDAEFDNGIINANKSGVGVGGQAEDQTIIKNMTGQATHGSYQNNTNSCASCHQTHTGAGEALIFKDSVYTTCTACHDGTLGFYNVFATSTAGTFAGTEAGNASMHLADGTVDINTAPGGKTGGSTTEGGTDWGDEFNCASCHAPHGSYSDRLLAYNPNGIQSASPNLGAPNYDAGGKKNVSVNVYGINNGAAYPDVNAAAATDKVVFFNTKAALQALSTAGTLVGWDTFAANNSGNVADADVVAVYVYKADLDYANTKDDIHDYRWSIDTTPWLYGYDNRTNFRYWTALKKTAAEDFDGNTQIIKPLTKKADIESATTKGGQYMFGNAYLLIPSEKLPSMTGGYALTNYDWMDISQAIIVKFGFNAPVVSGGFTFTTVKETSYTATPAGTNLSAFCAGCHVDYMVTAGDGAVEDGLGQGTYTQAYRHNTKSASYACLKCHFAHGTDITVMKDALDKDLATLTTEMGETAARAYLLDTNPSSAIKRYTNMAICWKCHTSSHAEQLINGNADYYNTYNADQNDVAHGG